MRTIFLSLLLTSFSLLAPLAAQTLPEIPKSQRVLSVEEVKNFWVNRMPVPREPSRLARSYQSLIVQYHQEVGSRHRLIQAIEAGEYDQLATIVMLRHNIVAYRLKGDDDQVLALSAELAALQAVADKAQAERDNADRLERLIAATDRLAAAIENNDGVVPDDAQEMVAEIVPFERDRSDRRSLITHLHDEIAICRQPIIVGHQPYYPQVHPPHTHRPHPGHSKPTVVHTPTAPAVTPRPQQPNYRPAPANSQPQVRPAGVPSQPAVRQPQVRPAGTSSQSKLR